MPKRLWPPGVTASQTPRQGEQQKLRYQETVSLDSDSEAAAMWRREGAAHPLPERGMVGAGLSESGGGALHQDWSLGAALCTEKPLPSLLVVGPEQRGTEGRWLPRDKGLR